MDTVKSCLLTLWLVSFAATAFAQPVPAPRPANPNANPAHEKLKFEAEDAYQANDFAKTIELTGRVLAENPRDHVALYLRASARVELGQMTGQAKEIRAGVEDAREALRHGGTDQINYYLPYFYGMTSLSQLENRPEHADVVVSFSQTVLQRPGLKPDEAANLHYQRATAEVFLQKYADAAKDFTAAIQKEPGHVGARLGLADVYMRQGDIAKAEAAFTDAVQAVPNNPLVYNNRGMFFQNQGKSQQAIADFSRAIELDKSYTVAYTNRGFAAMSEGNSQAAETDFSASLQIDPAQPLVYSLRGTARLSRGDAQAAEADYLQSLRLAPQNPIAQADLGFARYFRGDFAGAATALDAAVTADNNLRYLNPWRYWAAIKSGQNAATAEAKLGDLKTKPAADRDWVDQLGLFLSGAIDQAALEASIVKTDPQLQVAQQCEAYFFQAEKLAKSGDAAGANALYQKVLATNQKHLSAYRGAQYALKSFGAAN